MTPFKQILPIPESTVVGVGGYTVPADKYGFLQMYAATSSRVRMSDASASGTLSTAGTAGVCTGSQWLTEGDTLSVASSYPSASSGSIVMATAITNSYTAGYSRVLLNSTIVCQAISSISAGGSVNSSSIPYAYTHEGAAGWSISLFAIPKDNLPEVLKQGN